MVTEDLENTHLIDDLISIYESLRSFHGKLYRVPHRYRSTFAKVAKIVRRLGVTPVQYIQACFEYYKPMCYVNMLLKPPPILYDKDYRAVYKKDLLIRLKSQLYILKEQLAYRDLVDILEDPNNEFSVVLKYILYKKLNNPKYALYEKPAQRFLQDDIYSEIYGIVEGVLGDDI